LLNAADEAVTIIYHSNATVCEIGQPLYKHPSDVVWTDMGDTDRVILIPIGILLTVVGSAIYLKFMWDLDAIGRERLENDSGSHWQFEKLPWMQGTLRLGVIMICGSCLAMAVPELHDIIDIFICFYKAYAYYCLAMVAVIQYGGPANLIRDGELKGTLQDPTSAQIIWAQPPLCCVWGLFYFWNPCGWMQKRIANFNDLMWMRAFISQFLIIGPAASALNVVVTYEGVNPDNKSLVALISQMLSMVSMMMALYAIFVFIGITEKNQWIPIQVLDHSKAKLDVLEAATRTDSSLTAAEATKKHMEETDVVDEHTQNIKPMNMWIAFVSAVPALAGIIVSLVITSDEKQDNGDTFCMNDRHTFMVNFVTIIIGFLGSFVAQKVFYMPNAMIVGRESIASRKLEAEVMPAWIMEELVDNYKLTIAARMQDRAENQLEPHKDPQLAQKMELHKEPPPQTFFQKWTTHVSGPAKERVDANVAAYREVYATYATGEAEFQMDIQDAAGQISESPKVFADKEGEKLAGQAPGVAP